jgi:glycosyltransferase involved in cell wall biosynthesis
MVNISLILCMCDRFQSLGKALDNVAAQALVEPVEGEVLLIDNTSRDQTREVLEGFCHR